MARTFYSVINLVHIVTLACMIRNNQCQTNDDGDSIEVQFEVVEESRVNTEVGNVLEASGIRDLYPEEDFNTVQFEFVESPRFPFELDRFTGVVRVSGRLDREAWCANRAQCLDEVNVYVFIPDPAPQSVPRVLNLIKLKLHVYDINDNSPQFLTETRGVVRVQILENASPGFSVDLPTAIDADSTMFGVQGYNISVPGGGHQDIFTLRQTGGRVRLVLARELDREQQELYVLNYIAYDGGTPTPMIGTVLLEIEVADANDNSPRFAQPSYTVVVPESTEPHTSLLSVSAVDNDAGDNGQVYYTLSAYTRSLHGNTFVLDRESGQLSLGERLLNYEDTTHYRLDVVASDGGVSSVPAETTIDIEVTDVNDSPPSIRIRSLTIAGSNSAIAMENREAGAFVANVMINDADEGLGGEVECSLNQPEFELSNGNSRIQTTSVLDRENIGGFQLTLTCHDLGDPQLTSEESVYVQVGDENDNAPIFEHQSYEGEIIENNYIGTYVLKVNATDLDIGSNAFVTYELGNTRDAEMFNVDEITGVISARAVFDREDVSSVHFLVYAIDAGHPAQTSTAEVSVQVIDVNDETPMFLDESYSFGVKENETPGYELGVVSAIDRDGPTYSTITYSIMPSDSAVMERFSINPTNGHINTTVRLDREQRSVYHLVVRATDSGNPPLSGSSRVTIYLADLNDNRPLFDFPRVDNNTVLTSPGLPVGSTVTTVHATDLDSGANANVTYVIIDGNINSRFMLHPITGQLVVNKSLTDYQDATFSLEISARDNKHDTMTFLYITVNQTAPAVYGHSKILSGHNFIVVVILAAVSGAVMLLLIAAIVTIHRGRRVRNNKREGQYNCRRAESTRRSYESAPVKNSSWHGFKNAKKKTAQLSATVKDERSFSSEVEAGPGVRGNDSTKSWTTLHHQHPSGDNSGQWQPQACSSMMTNKSPYNSALTLAVQPLPRDAADLNRYDAPPKNREWNTNAHDHTEMTMMPTSAADCVEHDRDSLYSGSDSNTDSGRGCSEEGEASVGALSQSKSMQSFASSRAAQVVPVGSQSQCYSPNGNTSLESPYSSHDWTPSVTPQHHGYSPNLNTAFTGSYDSQHPPPRGKQRYKSAEDTGTIPGYHRYGLPLDTVSEDGGSTTSGSYVVDDDEDRRCTRKPSKRQSADAEEICRNIEMLCNYKPYGRLNSDSVV